ncbi:MAG: hypothetical protein OXB86_03905 [Bdellovibrionales bacterium]|nr:hypothetical protein [Bdellovibrionales bacterium]
MVSLAPPLQAVLEIRLYIENGNSVSQAIKTYVQSSAKDSFAKELGLWLFAEETGGAFNIKALKSIYRKHLLDILKRGLKGEPILEILEEYERDLIEICKEDLEKHLQKLPFIALIPLLLFEFPALLLILVGPLLLNLLSALQS